MTPIDETATLWPARKYTADDGLFQFVPLVIKGAFKTKTTYYSSLLQLSFQYTPDTKIHWGCIRLLGIHSSGDI